MQKIFIFLILVPAIFSCTNRNEQEKPENISDTTVVDSIAIINDPKNNLHVQTNSFSEIDSSGIIMFPLSVGETSRDGSFYYKEIPYNNYWNIIFFNSKTSAYHLLSERKMLIGGYDVKYSSDEDTDISSHTYISYLVTVDDYNKDKKLTDADPEYLFISDKEGNNFRQISPPGYHLKSWKYLKSVNLFVMSVVKDSDNNKKFEAQDEVTTFKIDVDKDTIPTEVFSPEFKNKLKLLFDRGWKRIKK